MLVTAFRRAAAALCRGRDGRQRQRGFSTAETAVVITAMSVLAAASTPAAMKFLNSARSIQARGDVKVIATSMSLLMADLGSSFLRIPGSDTVVGMLVSQGDVPEAGATDSGEWTAPEDGSEVLNLEAVLYDNRLGFETGDNRPMSGWSGPYMQAPIGPDAWGNRYMVNARHLRPGSGAATFVFSAGPDGIIQTPFSSPAPRTTGDDVIHILQGS